MPRIQNMADYIARHRKIQLDVSGYLEMAKSNYQRLDQNTRKQLDRDQVRFFHANNQDSRIRFAQRVLDHVNAWVDGADSPVKLHGVTLIPDNFAMTEADAPDFDVSTLQEWVQELLSGFDYIAMVEAALFPGWPHGQPTISWHAHLFSVGAKRHRLDRKVAPVRSSYRSLVNGIDAVFVENIGRNQLEEKILYMLKAPLTCYHPYPKKKNVVDSTTDEMIKEPTGGWKISKPDLRTGGHVRMIKVMRNQQLDKLIFGGGAGISVVDKIRRQTFLEEWSE